MKYLLISAALLFTFISAEAQRETKTVKVLLLVSDTTANQPYSVFSFIGYEVLEKHNTSEGVIDPGLAMCVDSDGKMVSCYSDYWTHVKYLHRNKSLLNERLVVWQSKEVK